MPGFLTLVPMILDVVGNEKYQKAFKALVEKIVNGLPELDLPQSELSYEEAMRYFIDHKNDNLKIAKGAMIKSLEGDKHIIVQIFLDRDNAVVCDDNGSPLGVKCKVDRLGSELQGVFEQNQVVFVE